MKDIIKKHVEENNASFGYVHSWGHLPARESVVKDAKRCYTDYQLTVNDVVFANGLGAGIGIIYSVLPPGARVIGPSPSYPTHASLEAFATGGERIAYRLDPDNEWQPDLADLEKQVAGHPEVTGILVINPNNPTGGVYSREVLEKIVEIAQKNNLFIIADEIYYRMVYNGREHYHLTEVAAGRVPLIVMRGVSKDVPWPGSRCGWIEFHNRNLDADFEEYTKAIQQRILLEVFATALPQHVLLEIYEHPDFPAWLEANNKKLEENGNAIAEILNSVPEINCNQPNGAFYITVVFKEGSLNNQQTLPIAHEGVKKYIEELVDQPGLQPDKRMVYYILASTGIMVTPASDFYSEHQGFRVTSLERDPEKLKATYGRLKQAIEEYLKS